MDAELGGEQQRVQMFCLRSMASAGAFHQAYPHASQQAFLEAHELAFHYFGGVFHLLRYDNLRSAVQRILRGSQREETARFIAEPYRSRDQVLAAALALLHHHHPRTLAAARPPAYWTLVQGREPVDTRRGPRHNGRRALSLRLLTLMGRKMGTVPDPRRLEGSTTSPPGELVAFTLAGWRPSPRCLMVNRPSKSSGPPQS